MADQRNGNDGGSEDTAYVIVAYDGERDVPAVQSYPVVQMQSLTLVWKECG